MNDKEQGGSNPLIAAYNTPHDTVPFPLIKPCHIEEAIVEGIRRDNELIERITGNPEAPTFDNTMEYCESDATHYYDLLERACSVLYNLRSANTTDELDDVAQRMEPLLTRHANDIRMNEKLFRRVAKVRHSHRRLTAEERTLVRDCYDAFVRGGALLDSEGKATLRRLTEEAGMLALQFSQNLLKETKAYALHITDPAQIASLPDSARNAAAQTAKERGVEGWVFTLDQPSYGPFMTHCSERSLRRQMYMAKNTLCLNAGPTCNVEICRRIVDIHREIAQLLGYPTYADMKMRRRMAGSVGGVRRLLKKLIKAYAPTAQEETESLRRFANRIEGKVFEIEPWDFSYYSHKQQLKKYNVDAEMVRPYLPIDKVIDGVFGLAHRLYGITFEPNTAIPVYHPDVKAYEVRDADGSYLAVLYADFFPRDGKQGGAWMTTYQSQSITRDGTNIRPHVSLVMNLTKPTDTTPSLLTIGEVETFLHEFGHALHAIFANTRYEALSGTNVWWDFVEMPSQFMENYVAHKDFLNTFATHYLTGEPLPEALIRRIGRSRRYHAAYSCMRQVSYALLDMAYYTLTGPAPSDLEAFEREAWRDAMVMATPKGTCMSVQFSHIMAGGYAAGYYSYKWAEVIACDAFSVFRRRGIFNPDTAERFRTTILSRGGTENPGLLYRRFRIGNPTIDAMLRRDGITTRKE